MVVLKLVILIIPAYFVTVYGRRSAKSLADVVATDQFLYVGLSHCHLTTEGKPPPRSCPYHAVYQTSTLNTDPPCSGARLHLWLNENAQPRALVLSSSVEGLTVAKLNKIKWPSETGNLFSFRKEPVDLDNPTYFPQKIEYRKVVWTLFDSYYRLLYVVQDKTYEGFRNVECLVFVVSFYDNGYIGFSKIGQVDVHPNNDIRLLWTEDPYQRKFYYVLKDGNNASLFSIPYSKILSVLASGQPGAWEYGFRGFPTYLSVSKGVAISYYNHSGKVLQLTENLKNLKEAGVLCETKSERLRSGDFLNLFLIFDEDYCLVKENGTAAVNCTHMVDPSQALEHMDETDRNSCSASSIIYWLIAAICVLGFFILVLAIHAWRTRERIDETFFKAERPKIHYYPTFMSITDPSVDF